MEFDKSKVYTALNADELKVGSKVIVADDLEALKSRIGSDSEPSYLKKIAPENCEFRFTLENGAVYALAYLVEKPEGLKCTDLKVGDVIQSEFVDCDTLTIRVIERMITEIDRQGTKACRIRAGTDWLTDEELKDWEKVE